MGRSSPVFVGNAKHLKLLLSATDSKDPGLWNSFVSTNGPAFSADLRGADLSGKDLSGFHLQNARLQNSDLKGTNFTNADLTKASLTGAQLEGADFKGAKIPRPKVKVNIVPPPEGEDQGPYRKLRAQKAQEAAQEFLKERREKESADIIRKMHNKSLYRVDEDGE